MSLCGFACCHCGRCGKDPAARYGISAIAGKCSACGTFNGPHDTVCSHCGVPLDAVKTMASRPRSEMSNPSLLKRKV